MTARITAGTGPGSFYCHEALHMASVLTGLVENNLVYHPSIEANAKWLALAEKARDALCDLYQMIGMEHIDG